MIVSKRLAAASMYLSLPLVVPPLSAAPIEHQAAEEGDPRGVWTGSLLQKDWTFEFTAQAGIWSGRYKTQGGVNWHPLNAVVVSGRSVSFTMDTRPKFRFALETDMTKPIMTGTVAIDGIATVPFTASRTA